MFVLLIIGVNLEEINFLRLTFSLAKPANDHNTFIVEKVGIQKVKMMLSWTFVREVAVKRRDANLKRGARPLDLVM